MKKREDTKLEMNIQSCRWCKYRCTVDVTIRASGQNVSLNGCGVKGVYSINGNVMRGDKCEDFWTDAAALRKAIQENRGNVKAMEGVVKDMRRQGRQMEMMLEKYEEGYNDARMESAKTASAGGFEEKEKRPEAGAGGVIAER